VAKPLLLAVFGSDHACPVEIAVETSTLNSWSPAELQTMFQARVTNTEVLNGSGRFGMVTIKLFVGAMHPEGSVSAKVVSTLTLLAVPLLCRPAEAETMKDRPVVAVVGEMRPVETTLTSAAGTGVGAGVGSGVGTGVGSGVGAGVVAPAQPRADCLSAP
jgi:hypothetical protein